MEILSLIISTLCFAGGFVYSVLAIRSGWHRPKVPNMVIMAAGFGLQSLFLQFRGEMHGRCPVTSGAEILVFLSWSTVLLYFILGRTFRLSLLGVFTSPLVFFFQGTALLSLLIADTGPCPAETMDPWREFHIGVSLLAYGAFALAFIAGFMHLLQNRQLKRRQMGLLFHNLPPIRYLLSALVRLVAIGLALLLVGIATAFLVEGEVHWAHVGSAVVSWVIYALLMILHLTKKIGPTKFAAGAVAAFLFPLIHLAFF